MAEEDIYEDPAQRRNLRLEYRKLITDTEQNRHEFIQPDSTGLHQALNKCDELFPQVRRTREAALDSQFLVLVSNLGREQAQHLQTGIVTFEPHTFAEKLITFMGGRHVGGDPDEGEMQHKRLESLDWEKMGKIAIDSLRRTPTIEFMHGPISMDAPVKKVRDPNKSKTGDKPGAGEKVTPQQLAKVDNNEEATTKEVQRVSEFLDKVTDPGTSEGLAKPVSFFKFVTNPNSFSKTIENLFHMSFLINKGNAAIELDKNGLPVVYPTDPYSEQDFEEVISRKQVVMQFTMDDWKNITEIYKMNKPMIPTRVGNMGHHPSNEEMEED